MRFLRPVASFPVMLASTPALLPGAPDPLADLPRCGLADLDASSPLRPGALTLVDAASARAHDVLYAWMADAAVRAQAVLVADGCNFLDVYRLASAARRRAIARFPDATRADLAAHEEMALDRVRLARGFTAHQLQTIVEDILPGQARDGEAPVGLLVAPGLLDMYLDDELSRDESRTLAARALSSLRRLAARLGAPCVVSNAALSPRSDHPLRVLLDESVDEHVLLQEAPQGGLHVRLPRRGAAFLAPGPGRTRLEDFLPPDERATPIAPLAPRAPGAWPASGRRMMGRFGEAWRREPWAVREAREAA